MWNVDSSILEIYGTFLFFLGAPLNVSSMSTIVPHHRLQAARDHIS